MSRHASASRRISWLPGRYAVCRLGPESAESAPPLAAGDWLSITRGSGEVSVVCEERFAPEDADVEAGWAVMRLEGPIPFEETGVLAALATPLAAAGIGIFAVSTYLTDYVLVKESEAARAQTTLEASGFTFRSELSASRASS